MNFLRHIVLIVTLAATAIDPIAVLAQANPDLPQIGSPAGAIANLEEEYQVGQMVLREMRERNALLEDPESAEYLQNLGLRLASQAPEAGRRFHYTLLDESDINAEATPGGFIFVNYGTVLLARNESELAGVLAHETAHVLQRHLVRGALAQSREGMATMAAMLGAILLGVLAGGHGQALEGGLVAVQGMSAQLQINFTRDQENEADRVGMMLLSKAGFDPLGMPNFFEDLSGRYGFSESMMPKMLVDHPVTSDRIAESRARAALLERPKRLTDSVGFGLVQERLRVLTASVDYDLGAYYEKRLAVADPPLSERYGQAFALMTRGDPLRAVELLKPLVVSHQSVIMLHSLLGQAQMAAGQVPEALGTFARANALFPRNVPLTVRYGEALIKADKPKQAHALLLDVFNVEEPTPAQIRLTALAANAAGDPGDAYYYMSEYNLSNGDLQMATEELQMALTVPGLNAVQRKRFQARLNEIREVLDNDRRDRGNRPQSRGS